MAQKTPIKAIYSGATATGLGEFASTDTVDYSDGGTGLASLGSAGQVLKVNSGASALEYGNVEAVINIDGMTDGSNVTLHATQDKIPFSDNGTEKYFTPTTLATYLGSLSQTLTNKTLTSPVLNTGVSGSAVLDEDNFASNSATQLATQQSIKTYVDSQAHLSLIDEDDMSSDSATRPPSQQSVKAYVDAQEHAVTATSTTTFTNKTLTSPVLNTGVSGSAILDEDNLGSDSATQLATQQSIKAYVDAQLTASDLDFQGDSGGALSIDLDSETLDIAGGTGIDTVGSSNTLTVAIDSTVSTLTGTQTLTNKTLTTPTITTPIINTGASLKNGSSSAGYADFYEDSDNGTNYARLIGPASTATVTLTLPAATDTLVGKATTDTLTNKSIDLGDNTLTGSLAEFNTALQSDSFVSLTGTETLTNKTLTTPVIAEIDSGSTITLDATTDIVLDADGGDIFFKDDGTIFGSATNNSGNLIIKSGTTTAATFTGANVNLAGNLIVTGDLTVSGDTTTVNTSTLSVEDPLIIAASGNNSSDAVDIGLYGLYDTSGSQDLYSGLFRDASDTKWKLFKDLQAAPTTTVNTSGTGYATGTLVANLEGNVTGDVTGNTSGTAATVTTAAQPAITSLGTLTTLSVDNITINGNDISSTAGTDLTITPLSGQQIVLDGTIIVDAGVVTGATSITSTSLVGALTGNADTATALATARTIAGQSFDGSGNITIASTDLSDTTSIVLLTSSQTLTNKTLTSPVLNTGVSGSAIKDEDDLTSDSATHLATQQSIKAYVDSQAHLSLIDEDNMASDSATRPPSQQSVKAYVDAQEHSVTATSTTTFTNKTISGASNTITALNATSIGDGSISNTEFQYLNGVSSNIQTQLDNQSTKGFAIAMAIAL